MINNAIGVKARSKLPIAYDFARFKMHSVAGTTTVSWTAQRGGVAYSGTMPISGTTTGSFATRGRFTGAGDAFIVQDTTATTPADLFGEICRLDNLAPGVASEAGGALMVLYAHQYTTLASSNVIVMGYGSGSRVDPGGWQISHKGSAQTNVFPKTTAEASVVLTKNFTSGPGAGVRFPMAVIFDVANGVTSLTINNDFASRATDGGLAAIRDAGLLVGKLGKAFRIAGDVNINTFAGLAGTFINAPTTGGTGGQIDNLWVLRVPASMTAQHGAIVDEHARNMRQRLTSLAR